MKETTEDTDLAYIKPTRIRKKAPRKDGGKDFRDIPGKPHAVLKNKKPRKTEKQNWKRFEEVE